MTEPAKSNGGGGYDDDPGLSFDDLTPREQAARRLLGLKALEKMLAEETKRSRDADGAAFTRAGQKETVDLPDGTLLGNVRTDKGTPGGWRVTDPGALRAWVEEHEPGAIVEQVTTVVAPGYVDDLLATIVNGADGRCAINPATGEVIDVPPGLSYVPDGPRKLVVTVDPKAPAAVRALLGPVLGQLGIGS